MLNMNLLPEALEMTASMLGGLLQPAATPKPQIAATVAPAQPSSRLKLPHALFAVALAR